MNEGSTFRLFISEISHLKPLLIQSCTSTLSRSNNLDINPTLSGGGGQRCVASMLLHARPSLCGHANGGCVHGSRPGVSWHRGAGLQTLLSWVVLLSPECPCWTPSELESGGAGWPEPPEPVTTGTSHRINQNGRQRLDGLRPPPRTDVPNGTLSP